MCCCPCLGDFCLIIISVLFPPLPVWIRRGICSCDSLINILLCILGYFPGLIHSWYIIAKYPPYTSRGDKIYFIYANDLENQTPRNRKNNCVHRHHHHHTNNNTITHQPSSTSSPAANYGSIAEPIAGSSSSNLVAPPAYTELDNKIQK